MRVSLTYFNAGGKVERVANVAVPPASDPGKPLDATLAALVGQHWPADDEGNPMTGFTAHALVGWDASEASGVGFAFATNPAS